MKKIRQRYIVFEIFTQNNQNFSEKSILKAIWKKLSQIFGEIISFKSGLWMVMWDENHLKGILRTDHFVDTEIIATLAMIKNINQCPVIFHSRKTTGTIKTAKKIWKDIFQIPLSR